MAVRLDYGLSLVGLAFVLMAGGISRTDPASWLAARGHRRKLAQELRRDSDESSRPRARAILDDPKCWLRSRATGLPDSGSESISAIYHEVVSRSDPCDADAHDAAMMQLSSSEQQRAQAEAARKQSFAKSREESSRLACERDVARAKQRGSHVFPVATAEALCARLVRRPC